MIKLSTLQEVNAIHQLTYLCNSLNAAIFTATAAAVAEFDIWRSRST